jgi:hypothetical protein
MTKAVWAVLIWSGTVLPGATITGHSQGGPPVEDPPYTVSLTPPTVQHIGTGDANLNGVFTAALGLLGTGYPAFPAVKAGAYPAGTFNILQYDPFILDNGIGGADFSVLYDDGVAAQRTDYDWIQIAHYHNWGTRGTGDSVDTQPGSGFPFYYQPSKLAQFKVSSFANAGQTGSIWEDPAKYPDSSKIQNPTAAGSLPAGDLLFVDQPTSRLTCADIDGRASAYFDLFLVTLTWNGQTGAQSAGTATVLDGLRWGVEITKTPVTAGNPGSLPEPATWLLTGSALLCGILFRATRRRGVIIMGVLHNAALSQYLRGRDPVGGRVPGRMR